MFLRKSPIPSRKKYTPADGAAKTIKMNSGKTLSLVLIPTIGSSEEDLKTAAYLASLSDKSKKAQAIRNSIERGSQTQLQITGVFKLISPRRENSTYGINLEDRMIRKGTMKEIDHWMSTMGGMIHNQTRKIVDQILRRGHEAVVVADHEHVLGVIELAV